MQKIFSIDPGYAKPSAVCVFNKGEINFISFNTSIDNINERFRIEPPSIILIEGQYFFRNIKTYTQLFATRIIIATLGLLNGHTIYTIPPQTWQKHIKTKPRMKSAELKIVSRLKASKELPQEIHRFSTPTGDDFADAYNMGMYFRSLPQPEKDKLLWVI